MPGVFRGPVARVGRERIATVPEPPCLVDGVAAKRLANRVAEEHRPMVDQQLPSWMHDLVFFQKEHVENCRVGLDRQPHELAQLVHGDVRIVLGDRLVDGPDTEDVPGGCEKDAIAVDIAVPSGHAISMRAVSYTHLTLPTIYSV